jgi:hypothetical protein
MAAGRVTEHLIKLFITGDDPRSLRTVELGNWLGRTTAEKDFADEHADGLGQHHRL